MEIPPINVLVQFIAAKVGNERNPIGKLSVQEKKDLKSQLRASGSTLTGIPKTLLLRAFLASGKEPLSSLLSVDTISKALTLRDSVKYGGKLVQKIIAFKGSDLFAALALMVGKGRKEAPSLSELRPVMGFTKKWTTNVLASGGRLSPETEESILDMIRLISEYIKPPKTLDDKAISKFKSQVLPLFETLFLIAGQSRSYGTYRAVLMTSELLINRYPSLIVNDIFSDETMTKQVDSFKSNLADGIRDLIREGNVARFMELNRLMGEMLDMRSIFIETAKRMWNSEGASLDIDMQSKIVATLSPDSAVLQQFRFARNTDDSSITHLASALLSSWDARNEGPVAVHSFHLFSSVAEKFFNLKLGGEVGTIVKFKRSVHEAVGDVAVLEDTRVQVVRPWVEWASGEKKRIIIRAIVKPQDDGDER
jgi:hypothetical protein